MRGNMGGGGGGGFILGYMAAKNPEAAGTGLAVFGGLMVAGGIAYGVAYGIDAPKREPLVNDIVSHSLTVCANANDPYRSHYTVDLKDGLSGVWSSQLKKYTPAAEHTPICGDGGLNGFVLPYNYDQVGTNYRGEYRVMGLVYTQADGTTQAFVVKPATGERAHNSIDDRPDSPLGMGKVLEALNTMPADVHQHVLADGTRVAAYLQQDGVTQQKGSSKIPDNDGAGWADQHRMSEILQHYEFKWPLRLSGYSQNAGPSLTASF